MQPSGLGVANGLLLWRAELRRLTADSVFQYGDRGCQQVGGGDNQAAMSVICRRVLLQVITQFLTDNLQTHAPERKRKPRTFSWSLCLVSSCTAAAEGGCAGKGAAP